VTALVIDKQTNNQSLFNQLGATVTNPPGGYNTESSQELTGSWLLSNDFGFGSKFG